MTKPRWVGDEKADIPVEGDCSHTHLSEAGRKGHIEDHSEQKAEVGTGCNDRMVVDVVVVEHTVFVAALATSARCMLVGHRGYYRTSQQLETAYLASPLAFLTAVS